MMKLKTLRAKQKARCDKEVRDLVRQALEEGGWTYAGAAELLGCSVGGVQSAVERDAKLKEERDQKAPRAGVGGRPT